MGKVIFSPKHSLEYNFKANTLQSLGTAWDTFLKRKKNKTSESVHFMIFEEGRKCAPELGIVFFSRNKVFHTAYILPKKQHI
jgi:hypothetical protein